LILDLQDDRVRKDRAAAWPLEEIGYRTATANTGDSIDAPVLFRGVQLFHKRPNGLVVLSGAASPSGAKARSRLRSTLPPRSPVSALRWGLRDRFRLKH